MPLEHVGRDVYLRHTSTDGKTHVMQHRCWDVDRFIASQQEAARKVNADAAANDPPKPAKAKVEQITQEQYRKERSK